MRLFLSPLFFSIMVYAGTARAQSMVIESAKQKIYQSATDTETLSNLLAINKYKNSMHGDTIYRYALWAKQLALKLKDKQAEAWAEYSLLTSDLAKGKADSVIYKIENNPVFKNIRQTDTALYYRTQLLKANAFNRINNRGAALDLQLKLLDEAEKEGDINTQLYALNYLGATYLNVSNTAAAKQTWLNGLQISETANGRENNEIKAYILSNLALLYFNTYYTNRTQQLSDSFFININKAIELSEQTESLGILASSLSLRGNFYGLIHETAAGEKDFIKGLAMSRKIGDPYYVVNDIAGLSSFYYSQKQYDKCAATAKQGLLIASSNKVKGMGITNLLRLLGLSYKATGDFKQYSNTLEQLITTVDSSIRINAADKIAEIQTKYDVQKKETIIANQKLDLFRRNLFLYGGGIVIVLLLGFLLYRFKKYQRRQRLKVAAMLEEEKQQHDTAIKDAEENERKRIAAELHDNLGVQANAILHSSSLLNKETQHNNEVVADLQETAKEMLHNLRETLWAMKTTDVSATDLWLRIINFMRQMGRHYPGISFKVEGVPPEQISISSGQALHAALVLKESVNNAVKHAQATIITAASNHKNGTWEISIADNGTGFDMDQALLQPESYGLRNMKQRAKAGNFNYHIEASGTKGTTTYVTLAV